MKVLVINPGATSTKVSVFDEENEVFKTNLVHSAQDLAPVYLRPPQAERLRNR